MTRNTTSNLHVILYCAMYCLSMMNHHHISISHQRGSKLTLRTLRSSSYYSVHFIQVRCSHIPTALRIILSIDIKQLNKYSFLHDMIVKYIARLIQGCYNSKCVMFHIVTIFAVIRYCYTEFYAFTTFLMDEVMPFLY